MSKAIQLSDVELAGALAGCDDDAAKKQHERRTSLRWTFPTLQPLAPYGQWGFPSAEMFQAVRCYDLSTGGLSFLMQGSPEFDFAVIGLGLPGQRKFFVLRIIYRREFKPGTNEYLVGCEFVERIRPPAGRSA